MKTPILQVDDDVILGLEGDLLYALLDSEYEHALQEWLAVWGRFMVHARLGNELQSVLAQGVSVHDSFEIGWLFRVWENDGPLLSVAISLDNSNTALADIYGFVSDAIDACSAAGGTAGIFGADLTQAAWYCGNPTAASGRLNQRH